MIQNDPSFLPRLLQQGQFLYRKPTCFSCCNEEQCFYRQRSFQFIIVLSWTRVRCWEKMVIHSVNSSFPVIWVRAEPLPFILLKHNGVHCERSRNCSSPSRSLCVLQQPSNHCLFSFFFSKHTHNCDFLRQGVLEVVNNVSLQGYPKMNYIRTPAFPDVSLGNQPQECQCLFLRKTMCTSP